MFRLTATISDHGQILGKHTFPNWFRVVSHLSQRRTGPVATLPQAIEAPDVVDLSKESHGTLFFPLR